MGHIKKGILITIAYSLCSALMRGLNFLFLPYFLVVLSLADIGLWDFNQMIFVRLSIVLTTLGISSLQRFYFLYSEPIVRQQVVGNSIVLLLLPLVFCSAAYCCIKPFVSSADIFLFNTCIITILYCVFAYLSAYARVKEQVAYYLALLCIQNIISSVGAIIGVWQGYGVQSFFYATLFSLLILIPFFMYMLFKNFNFSYSLLKDQCAYALPLMVYNMFYIGFFLIDRIILKWYDASDLMGIYAILWRFGSIFQILAMALVAAWPNMLFSLSNEKQDNQQNISTLIVYCIAFLCSMCIVTLCLSHCLFVWYLPKNTHFMIGCLPLFFLALTIFELARLFQAAFLISKQTRIIPLISFVILITQIILFLLYGFLYGTLHIWYFLIVNCGCFAVYAYLFYYYGQKIQGLINEKRIIPLLSCFVLYMLAFHSLLIFSHTIWPSFFVCMLWFGTIWTYCMNTYEKQFVKRIWKQYIYAKLFTKASIKMKNSSDLSVDPRIE